MPLDKLQDLILFEKRGEKSISFPINGSFIEFNGVRSYDLIEMKDPPEVSN
jgi:hypothetical protein